MSFKDFVSSHTGRQFFDTFREFVAAFTKYVEHLTRLNDIKEEYARQAREYQARIDAALKAKVDNDDIDDIDDNDDLDDDDDDDIEDDDNAGAASYNASCASCAHRETCSAMPPPPSMMPCAACGTMCSAALNVLIGWRGAIGLICVDCAEKKGLIDAQHAN